MNNVSLVTKEWAVAQGISTWFAEVTTSTNDVAKNDLKHSLFLTNHQESGRGRGSNQWHDKANGSNLICSWVFDLDSPPTHISGPVFGLALFKTCQKIWPDLDWKLKAPNDLQLKDKKIAGILLESQSQGNTHRLIFGLGMNIHQHPIEMAATHLCENTEVNEKSWKDFLSLLKQELEHAVTDCQRPRLQDLTCRQLTAALRVDRVDENGNIFVNLKKTSWTEL